MAEQPGTATDSNDRTPLPSYPARWALTARLGAIMNLRLDDQTGPVERASSRPDRAPRDLCNS